MRAPLALALLLFALLAGSCSPETPQTAATPRKIYALFVGIDKYRFSRTEIPGADFSDLKGAVGDTLRFQAVMGDLYAVAPGKPDTDGCDPGTGDSTTLLNACATRARILAALDAQIAARKPGDTLLFYFAGHGSRFLLRGATAVRAEWSWLATCFNLRALARGWQRGAFASN